MISSLYGILTNTVAQKTHVASWPSWVTCRDLVTRGWSAYIMLEHDDSMVLMACPHCHRKVRLSHKSETVSLFCDSMDRALHCIGNS